MQKPLNIAAVASVCVFGVEQPGQHMTIANDIRMDHILWYKQAELT